MKQSITTELARPALGAILLNKANLSQSRFKDSRLDIPESEPRSINFFSQEVREGFKSGSIPNLEIACYNLINTFTANNYPFKATQFLPILDSIQLTSVEINQFLQNPVKKNVLVQNDLIKIVLIHWPSNAFAPIHGHPIGGCVFKVLAGSFMETRYSSNEDRKPLSKSKFMKGAMAYIDDTMALHAIENPFKKPAVSLHIYTPGIRF